MSGSPSPERPAGLRRAIPLLSAAVMTLIFLIIASTQLVLSVEGFTLLSALLLGLFGLLTFVITWLSVTGVVAWSSRRTGR